MLKSLLILGLLLLLFNITEADVGTATFYNPPYLPTSCFGNNPNQFPAENLFVAAGEGIWDNGASCGRQYLVRCLSASSPGECSPGGQTIQVTVVDRALTVVSRPATQGATMVFSTAAFSTIVADTSTVNVINVEFTQI